MTINMWHLSHDHIDHSIGLQSDVWIGQIVNCFMVSRICYKCTCTLGCGLFCKFCGSKEHMQAHLKFGEKGPKT